MLQRPLRAEARTEIQDGQTKRGEVGKATDGDRQEETLPDHYNSNTLRYFQHLLFFFFPQDDAEESLQSTRVIRLILSLIN